MLPPPAGALTAGSFSAHGNLVFPFSADAENSVEKFVPNVKKIKICPMQWPCLWQQQQSKSNLNLPGRSLLGQQICPHPSFLSAGICANWIRNKEKENKALDVQRNVFLCLFTSTPEL